MQFSSVLQSRTSRVVLLLLLLLGMPFLVHAQEATLVGTVTDPSGGVVPNVTITITNIQTGAVRTLATNEAGQYVVPSLPIGKYNLKAEASGFKVEENKGVVLNTNDRVRVDFQMKVGTKAEVVSVEANALAVQADSSEQSSLVSATQISELATNGRTIYSYVSLTPGASSLNPDSQLPVPTGGASSNISFNGNRSGHNLYLLDGGENSDRGGAGTSSVLPSVDAIAETQTLTSNYSADYGLSSGATISSAVKSGTATLHASAWEFFRNDALDARNFFNPAPNPIGELRYNIFGFNVGGPVTFGKLYNPDKKRTFFFYNMEWRKFVFGGSPINQTVPDPATYGGDFGSTTITVPSASTVSAAVLARNCPGGTLPAGIVQGSAFPNNTIPSCMLDPNTTALLTAGGTYGGIFPKPTSGTQFVKPVAVPTNVKEEIVRIDHNFTDKFSVYGHFLAEQIANNQSRTMWSGDNVPSIGNTFGNPSYAAVIHTTYTISPSLVNEASFNYNGNRINILPLGLYKSPFTPVGYFANAVNVDNRIPSINLGGSTGSNYTVNWMPWVNKADDYQIRDDVSWTKGRHQLRMGASWAIYKKIQDWFKNTQGNYTFNGTFSGNDFADFLLGLGQNYSQDALKSAGHWDNVSWAIYFQDNYRVNSRLTLNLGLRWDGIPHTYEETNQMANFYPTLYNSADAAVFADSSANTVSSSSPGLFTNSALGATFYTNGIGICGQGGVPRGCVNDSWKNFQPRLGFAYDLRGNGKTVIRGGYGVMNERIQGNDVYNNAGTVPLAASVSFNNVVFNDPAESTLGTVASGSIPVNNITGLDKPNYAAPRSTQFSLGIQQALGKSVLSVAYVGTQNRHQNYYQEINLPNESLLPGYVNNTTTVAYNTVVPYLGYHGIRLARNEANGDYNGLQMSMRGSLLSNGLTYQVGYTWSHTNDSGSNGSSAGDLGNVTNPYLGWKYDFGPSNFDHRNMFFANFVYDLPFFRHSDSKATKMMLGGWEISGIVTVQSGAPLNIGLSGNSASSFIPNSQNRPDQTGTGHDPHTVTEWFDTSIYARPACVTGPDCWGNTKRNSVWGPGRDNWNISLFKNFMFSESRGSYLQFRGEFFNIWNHTQFIGDESNNGISRNFGASNFGQVTNAWDPRTIQLALKLYF